MVGETLLKKPWVLVTDEDFPGRFLAAHRALGHRRMANDPTSKAQTRALVNELNRQYARHGAEMESAGRLVNVHERAKVWLVVGTDIENLGRSERVTFEDRADADRFLAAPWVPTVRWSEPQIVMMGEAQQLDRPF